MKWFKCLIILAFISIILLIYNLLHQNNRIITLHWKRHHSKLSVLSLSFSPDSFILSSGSEDGTIKLWWIKDGRIINILKGYVRRVNCLAFSPNGKYLVSGGDDGIVDFWLTKTNKVTRSYDLKKTIDFKNPIKFLIFLSDKELLVGSDRIISICKFLDNNMIKSKHIFRTSQLIYCGALSPNKRLLAIGGSDNQIEVWIIANTQLYRKIGRHTGSIFSIAFTPNGQFLVSGGEYDDIKIWRIKDSKLIHTLKGHQGLLGLGWTSSIIFSQDGRFMVSGGGDGIFRIWRTKEWKVIYEKQIGSSISSLVVSSNGNFLAIGDIKGFIHLFKFKINLKYK